MGLLLDGGRSPVVWKAIGLTGLAVLAGCVTPSGLEASPPYSDSRKPLPSWTSGKRSSPFSAVGGVSLAMLGLFVIGWSASKSVPRSEALVVLLLFAFTWMAWRNLAPGMALMAPLAAHRLTRGFPGVGSPEPRWSVPAGVACFVALTLAGVVNVSTKPNLPADSQPIRVGANHRRRYLPANAC